MKNKLSILSISFMLMISVCIVGCMNKQQTKEEIYDDFKDQISNRIEFNSSLTYNEYQEFLSLFKYILYYVIINNRRNI